MPYEDFHPSEPVELEAEVVQRIESDFTPEDRVAVKAILAKEMARLAFYGLQPTGPLPLYVVLLSCGNRLLFDHNIKVFRGDEGDYRDILILGRKQFPEIGSDFSMSDDQG